MDRQVRQKIDAVAKKGLEVLGQDVAMLKLVAFVAAEVAEVPVDDIDDHIHFAFDMAA